MDSTADKMGMIMLVSITFFMVFLLVAVGYISYKLVDLTYDIASNASGENTKPPVVTIPVLTGANEKCFNATADYTVPDNGKLQAILGTVSKEAEFVSNQWKVCFDSNVSGDLYFEGEFDQEYQTFGPYRNSWGDKQAVLGPWTATSDTGYTGMVYSTVDENLPDEFSLLGFEKLNEHEMVFSFNSQAGSAVTLSNPEYKGFAIWEAELGLPESLNLASKDGIVELKNLDESGNMLVFVSTKTE